MPVLCGRRRRAGHYVTDLFESWETHSTEDPVWEFDSESIDDSGPEFGFGAGRRPDSEDFEVNLGFMNNDVYDNNDAFWANDNSHICDNERGEFEWEGVSERIHVDAKENQNSVIDRIEEISISSDVALRGENSQLGGGGEEGEEEERDLEWEVLLLEVDDWYRNFELDGSEDHNIDGSDVAQINIPEDNIFAMEYDTIFGQALKGSPPAAKSVVENLPFVVLTKEEPGENGVEVICAICKDEVAIGEKVTRMPCCHLYHGDCILPWLRIRNMCPVCRYELPTDDADYERRRNERGSS